MERILISACLLGMPCRYDGKSVEKAGVSELIKIAQPIPFCAEIYGGLPTPRSSAEVTGERVCTRDGTDVTEAFMRGAALGVRLAKQFGCKRALLKDKSPSCGKGMIYSGHFDRTLVPGNGLLAQALTDAGVKVYSSEELDVLMKDLEESAYVQM